MKHLYQGVVMLSEETGVRNSHCSGVFESEAEALGDFVRRTLEKFPRRSIVNAACYQVPDEMVVRAAEELGCVQIY